MMMFHFQVTVHRPGGEIAVGQTELAMADLPPLPPISNGLTQYSTDDLLEELRRRATAAEEMP